MRVIPPMLAAIALLTASGRSKIAAVYTGDPEDLG
jgi:hypothetical protein